MLTPSPFIKIDSLDGNDCVFYLYHASHPIANELRVTMMDKVPSMAIDVVNVMKNESVLMDELIVHRLGLIPLESHQVDNYEFPDQCHCSGQCSKCSAVIYLQIKSTNINNLSWLRSITCRDLKPSNDHQIKPVKHNVLGKEEGIVIVPLRNDQTLDFECFATKGYGSQHAKWSPVSKVVYWPDDQDKSDNPRFYFSIETIGSLTVLELLKSACKILATKSINISIRE
uniref:RPB3 subunit of eukaryotic RNA polymerase II n=1 Tax=Pithovirus LCPAC201 TaxID=2506591 RepID=A0A481Z5U4_9VIRU|nr:MAG: RPB3 subunit of eukaryotic RNA polymerase II [Pithovirus LCPAC201]